MNQLEQVQRSATRLVHGIRKLDYQDRLQELNLFPQVYRRTRGDLLTIRKILRGSLGEDIKEFFPLKEDARRGHSFTLRKLRPGGLPAIFRLSRRSANLWNSLPADVAQEDDEAKFKTKLDKLLKNMWHREWH